MQSEGKTQTDQDELYDQIIADLEQVETHPDCITINYEYIKQWVSDLVSYGLPISEFLTKPSDNDDAISMRHSPSQASLATGYGTLSLSDTHGVWDQSVLLNRTHIPVESTDASSNSIYADPRHAASRPDDQPDPDHVNQILGSLLDGDPFLTYDATKVIARIQRAYHRLDYTNRGSLTRNEIVKASKQALEFVGIFESTIGRLQLTKVISSFDKEKDGRYDEEMFTLIIHKLVQLSLEIKRQQLLDVLEKHSLAAIELLEQESQSQLTAICNGLDDATNGGKEKFICPFGWRVDSPGSEYPLFETISERTWKTMPKLSRDSFSMMALSAAWAVEQIDSMQTTWLPLAPIALRRMFLDGFDRIRHAALKFTSFESDEGGPYELSFMDEFIAIYHILRHVEPKLASVLSSTAHNIEDIRVQAYSGICNILGFCHLLSEGLATSNDKDKMVAQTFTFITLSTIWRKAQASAASRYVVQSMGDWLDVKRVALQCKQLNTVHLRQRAVSLAQAALHETIATAVNPTAVGVTSGLSVTGVKAPRFYYKGKSFLFRCRKKPNYTVNIPS